MQKRPTMATRAVSTERDVGGEAGARRHRLQCWDQCVWEGRAVAAGPGAAERDVGGEAGARRHQLQCWDQCLREGRAVAAGAGAAERDRALALLSEMWEASLQPNVISYNMREARLEPNVMSHIAGISACEKGEQWQRALALLSEMWEARLEPNVITSALGSARARRASSGSRRWRC
ncbi:unnamed protein product [Prorocentrum cordatum]|uniref:Pentatricopeptide repeat-containing protein n=1 Tax=Prorocentrum cordatum TaxID=2364126 RepID=A0ABN9R270_9DINO|nr:unnamed protein product [Polarella glacialis]